MGHLCSAESESVSEPGCDAFKNNFDHDDIVIWICF